ncbi:MAG: hypothetical protein FRX49_08929 [Trebouxia sp. A1-2]|nr:MAG: hypothetical protein FRX49_08929 [Trebouxia sp. A1-2]
MQGSNGIGSSVQHTASVSCNSLQADKLVFIASQAAVDKRGSQEDMHEQDVAALWEELGSKSQKKRMKRRRRSIMRRAQQRRMGAIWC